jgi:hypothetical protein
MDENNFQPFWFTRPAIGSLPYSVLFYVIWLLVTAALFALSYFLLFRMQDGPFQGLVPQGTLEGSQQVGVPGTDADLPPAYTPAATGVIVHPMPTWLQENGEWTNGPTPVRPAAPVNTRTPIIPIVSHGFGYNNQSATLSEATAIRRTGTRAGFYTTNTIDGRRALWHNGIIGVTPAVYGEWLAEMRLKFVGQSATPTAIARFYKVIQELYEAEVEAGVVALLPATQREKLFAQLMKDWMSTPAQHELALASMLNAQEQYGMELREQIIARNIDPVEVELSWFGRVLVFLGLSTARGGRARLPTN